MITEGSVVQIKYDIEAAFEDFWLPLSKDKKKARGTIAQVTNVGEMGGVKYYQLRYYGQFPESCVQDVTHKYDHLSEEELQDALYVSWRNRKTYSGLAMGDLVLVKKSAPKHCKYITANMKHAIGQRARVFGVYRRPDGGVSAMISKNTNFPEEALIVIDRTNSSTVMYAESDKDKKKKKIVKPKKSYRKRVRFVDAPALNYKENLQSKSPIEL